MSEQYEFAGASRLERTGDDSVDAVLAELEQLGADDTLERHVAVLTDAQAALQRRLTATDG